MVQMNKSGLWKGVVHNRIGHFKFINVEILNDRVPRRGEPERGKWGQRYRQKPGSVQELLQRMNLQVESNISPRLEQTDSHLHGVECKVERNLLLYVSLFDVPVALLSPSPFVPSRATRFPPLYHTLFLFFSLFLATHRRISFPAHTLYNSQIPQTVTSLFCSILSSHSLSDSLILFLSSFIASSHPPCSFLSTPVLYILFLPFNSSWSFLFFSILPLRHLIHI